MKVQVENEKPFFAEFPYYLWGEVNYDSEGDCVVPTDRNWNYLFVQNRETCETFEIVGQDSILEIKGDSEKLEMKVAKFLIARCNGKLLEGVVELDSWDHEAANKRTERIQLDFNNTILKPFDSHLFWGSWKWTGCFATEFTWVGRMIMNSLLISDKRAVILCIDWLRAGTFNREQSDALRYALNLFTGCTFATDDEWIKWYDQTGNEKFPEPDFNLWMEELKRGSKNVL